MSCTVPPSTFSGKAKVFLTDAKQNNLPGNAYFNYIEYPLLFDAQVVIPHSLTH